MTLFNLKPKILHFITIIAFGLIILFFTAIFPISYDEFRLSHDTLSEILNQIKITLTTDSPRFMMIPYILLLNLGIAGRIIFIILNPLVQLSIIFGLFFIITGKKPNFSSKKDYYLFSILCLMYLLFIPNLCNNIFWMSGAFCYSWAFIPVLIILCLFRKTIDGEILKNSSFKQILMLFIGFCAGMSNENTGPMILGLFILFILYCKYKKIKIPSFYFYALAGICLGISAMFGSGAGKYRLYANWRYSAWISSPIINKLFVYLHKFNMFLNSNLWIPIITSLGYLLILYDTKFNILRNKNFLIGILFCLCGFVLSFVLFMSPAIGLRVFYSSALFFFISFAILLLILQNLYLMNSIKYILMGLFITWLVLLPSITIPYLCLYKADCERRQTIAEAVKNNRKEVFVNTLPIVRGPTENLTIEYYDILVPGYEEKLEKYFKIKLRYTYSNDFNLATTPF